MRSLFVRWCIFCIVLCGAVAASDREQMDVEPTVLHDLGNCMVEASDFQRDIAAEMEATAQAMWQRVCAWYDKQNLLANATCHRYYNVESMDWNERLDAAERFFDTHLARDSSLDTKMFANIVYAEYVKRIPELQKIGELGLQDTQLKSAHVASLLGTKRKTPQHISVAKMAKDRRRL